MELTNGCLCCSVKDDFVNALESLMLQQTPFDYILVETTGLADPGPVASALWTDDELEAGAYVRAMWRAQELLCAEQRMLLTSGCGSLGTCPRLFCVATSSRACRCGSGWHRHGGGRKAHPPAAAGTGAQRHERRAREHHGAA